MALALALPLAGAGCDMDGPPPAAPANPPADEPPPPPPPPAAGATAGGDPGADAQNGGMYASGEYNIGDSGDAYDDNDPSALSDFHGALDSYGTWSDDPKYGTVWTPNPTVVGQGFVPYSTAGHWVIGDDDQYVWVSDYDWGWAPFHYGRWIYIEGRGWAWVPGREYRGAWVDWGWDDGYSYVGWYPMVPLFYWYGGVAVGASFYVGPRWEYCPHGEVFASNVGARVIAGPTVASVAGRVHVAATPGVGPAPARLGFSAAQVPHATPVEAAKIAHAQAFSHPSTATTMGGSPRTATTGSRGFAGGSAAGRAEVSPGARPGTTQQSSSGGKHVPEGTAAPPRRAAPTYRGGGRPSGGGGMGGGGGHGGGGHHR